VLRLSKEQPQHNISRYYLIQIVPGLFGQWGVLREWGRIGQPGTVRQDWYVTESEAIQAAGILLEAKQKLGYSVTAIGYAADES